MTPAPNTPEWQLLLEQIRQRDFERKRQDQAFKASPEGQAILKSFGKANPEPTQYPLYDYPDPEPETLEPNPLVEARVARQVLSYEQDGVATKWRGESRATLQAPTITLCSFDAAFHVALTTAEDQYFPYRQTLGNALYRFATVIRACALLYNTKAKDRAVLCAMLPFNFVAEFCGYSREYIYQQLRTEKAGALFHSLIAFDGHVSSYKIIPKNAPEGAEPVRAHDGTLFTTRPTPCAANNPPKAAHWDWTRVWRDMYADVRDGRTVSNAIKNMNAIAPRAERRTWSSSHTQATKAISLVLQIAKTFFYLSLSSFNSQISVVSICEPDKFDAVHDALNQPIPSTSDGRNMWADRLAKSIYECVRDSKEDDFKGWLARAWTIAKAVVYGVGPAREVFLEALWVVLSREVSGTVRNLGAYLNAVLKARGWDSLEAECSKLRLGSSVVA